MPVIPALREDRGVRSPWPVSATQGNYDQPGLHEIASKVTRQMEKESSEREKAGLLPPRLSSILSPEGKSVTPQSLPFLLQEDLQIWN